MRIFIAVAMPLLMLSACSVETVDTSEVDYIRTNAEDFAELYCSCFFGEPWGSEEECVRTSLQDEASWACVLPIYADYQERCPAVVDSDLYWSLTIVNCLRERGCDFDCMEVELRSYEDEIQECQRRDGMHPGDIYWELQQCPRDYLRPEAM